MTAIMTSNAELTKLIGGLRLPSGEITPGKRSKRSLRRRNAIIATSFDLTGKRVLDVGCAEGLQSLYMSASAREVWGIDHRSSEIETARATAKALGITNVHFETADIRDPELFKRIGKFDLAIAWGFLHRIGDIFSLFYALEPIADAISLEWRTPIVPLMDTLSIAFHPPVLGPLDPMNTGRKADLTDRSAITDADKVEGDSAFWEPTPGAVKAMLHRLGYAHMKTIGYGEELVSEEIIMQKWYEHLNKVNLGKRALTEVPRARVHMLFEKTKGSIKLHDLTKPEQRFPKWDMAIAQPPQKRKKKLVFNREQHFKNIVENASDIIASYHSSENPSFAKEGLQLRDIDFSKLEIVTYESRQVARMMNSSSRLPRAVYRDEAFYYKIWRSDYSLHRTIIIGGKKKLIDLRDARGNELLPGFLLGFFDKKISSAFVCNIYHEERLVGYKMHAGSTISRYSPENPKHVAFVEAVIERTIETGLVFRDLKANNIVELPDGSLSLIDFDTPLATLYKFSRRVETKSGALAWFTLEKYRTFLNDALSSTPSDPRILRVRDALPLGIR